MAGLSKIKNIFCPTLKDGTRPKRKIMLYGFFGNNLGDDVFFDILLKRYPDTLFYVFFTAEYEPCFAKYNNVRYYSDSRPMIDKINRLGGKFGDGMLFEEMLLKICDGAVHIGDDHREDAVQHRIYRVERRGGEHEGELEGLGDAADKGADRGGG